MPLRPLLALILASGALMAAVTPRLTWGDLTARPRPTADATLSYGADPYQIVDIWVPAGKGPHPTVVMVHGGCWQTAIADAKLMNWVAADLRADGIAVWNIDYRGVDRPGGGYPGTFADVAAATDRLAAEARRFNLDIRHVVAVGHSAGGHLALWLAGRHRLPAGSALRTAKPLRIAHAVSLGGLPDLADIAASPDNGCGTQVVARLVGAGRSDPYADTSVPRLLPIGVSQDLVNGREDRIIPFRMAAAYVNMAAAAGDRAVLHTVPDTGHVELVAPGTPAWITAKRLIRDALANRR